MAAQNDDETLVGGKIGIGYDSSVSMRPDTAMPPAGPFAEVSVAGQAPWSDVRTRTTVRVNADGFTLETEYGNSTGKTAMVVGPDGVEAPEARASRSIDGFGASRYGAHAAIGAWGRVERTPGLPPGAYDSDGDGFKDGNRAESPEVGGRWGQTPTLDGNDANNNGVRDEYENPGLNPVETPDEDGDGFSDGSFAESPEMGGRETQADYGGALDTPDGDGDGFSDGSFAESPEMGGRETQADYGGALDTPDGDGDGFSDGSFAESPEMGGRETHADYGSADSATDGGDDGGNDASDSDSGGETSGGESGGGGPGGESGAGEPGGESSGGEPSGESSGAEPGGESSGAEPGGESSGAEPGGETSGGEPGADASGADTGGGATGGGYSEAGDPGDTGIA